MDFLNWSQVFKILSMERCFPFFKDAGLPSAIINNPQPLATCAKEFHLEFDATLTNPATRPTSNEDHLKIRQEILDSTFEKIGLAYNLETAKALHSWGLRYVVNRTEETSLSLWHELFLRLCKVIRKDEPVIESQLNSQDLELICGQVQQYLRSENHKFILQQTWSAELAPLTEWEEWLREDEQRGVGDLKTILGPVKTATSYFNAIIINYATWQLWQELPKQLSNQTIEKLVAWGREQVKNDYQNVVEFLQAPPFE